MKFTFITVSSPAIQCLIKAYEEICRLNKNAINLKLYYAVSEYNKGKIQDLIIDIKSSDMVFVDLMGSPVDTIKAVYEGLSHCNGDIIPYGNSAREFLHLGKFTAESMKSNGDSDKKPDMAAMKKMQNMAETMGKIMPGKMRDMKNYSQICKYFYLADYSNMLNMLYLILNEYSSVKNIPRPSEAKEAIISSICNPENMQTLKNFEDYEKVFGYDPQKPVIALLFYSHIYPMDYSGAVNQILKKLSEEGNVLPIAISGAEGVNDGSIRKLMFQFLPQKPAIILNTMSFRLGAGPMGGNFDAGINLLKDANVPYLHPYFMSKRTENEWTESIQGSTASEVLISIMLPEQDGAIDTIPVGAKTEPVYYQDFDVSTDEIKIIDERLNHLSHRVKKHIKLGRKSEKNRRIAIVCYNYPPGESNLFGGAFLDTFNSVANILKNLKVHGYNTEDITAEELMKIFCAGKLVNSGKYSDNCEEMIKYPLKKYKTFFDSFADKENVVKAWGTPAGTIMTDENQNFNIPASIFGNVLVGLQPSRGVHEDQDKLYHDKSIPPHHQYIAFYRYLHEEFKADAIIHVGTHGTIEFLQGKECGMSGGCYPDMLIGTLPHFYLYYLGNPSEAIIAKRRSHAAIISYQPPVFIPGELYGDFSELSAMIDEYHHQLSFSKSAAEDVLKNISKKAEQCNLSDDIEELEKELYRMNRSLIPKGLHCFGENYTSDEAMQYVKGLLRNTQGDYKSLRTLVAELKGHNIDFFEDKGDFKSLSLIDAESEIIFEEYLSMGKIPQNLLTTEFEKTLSYSRKIYETIQNNFEIPQLINALDSGYIPAKMAGDIYRNPDVLPGGFNLVQFDQRLVPSLTAVQRGTKIAENTISAYYQKNNCYPNSTAVILWGLETSRTQGETYGQIMGYLGVRLAKGNSQWNAKYELIPIEELGRPRIDVTINICGFFRDLFPLLIDSLDDIFHLLYEAQEDVNDNYFKANSAKIYKYLIDKGYDEDEAKHLAITRIFGPKEGEYGTGITSIIETKAWEKEEQIGNQFLSSLHFAYNRKMHGGDVEKLYEQNLKSVEVVSQIRDNNEYEITDLDHYYEFFGGLAKSVEMVSGKKAEMLITDTTGGRPITETVNKSIDRGIRTRVLNPKWIDGMLSHKYHGAQKISQRFENVMGLAATTGSVEQWIYNDLCSTYVENEEMRHRMQENNPHAYMDILEQMIEYNRRGYWDATQEQLDIIKNVYLENEERIEGEI